MRILPVDDLLYQPHNIDGAWLVGKGRLVFSDTLVLENLEEGKRKVQVECYIPRGSRSSFKEVVKQGISTNSNLVGLVRSNFLGVYRFQYSELHVAGRYDLQVPKEMKQPILGRENFYGCLAGRMGKNSQGFYIFRRQEKVYFDDETQTYLDENFSGRIFSQGKAFVYGKMVEEKVEVKYIDFDKMGVVEILKGEPGALAIVEGGELGIAHDGALSLEDS